MRTVTPGVSAAVFDLRNSHADFLSMTKITQNWVAVIIAIFAIFMLLSGGLTLLQQQQDQLKQKQTQTQPPVNSPQKNTDQTQSVPPVGANPILPTDRTIERHFGIDMASQSRMLERERSLLNQSTPEIRRQIAIMQLQIEQLQHAVFFHHGAHAFEGPIIPAIDPDLPIGVKPLTSKDIKESDEELGVPIPR